MLFGGDKIEEHFLLDSADDDGSSASQSKSMDM